MDKLLDYLKSKIDGFEFAKKSGAFIFTCPNIKNHKSSWKKPTATPMAGTNKVCCTLCHWTGTMEDIVRLLEPDKTSFTDNQVTEYLINSFKLDIYKELDFYQEKGWKLLKIAPNGKEAIEKWELASNSKADWIGYLSHGFNVALQTGEESGITVIDVDVKHEPKDKNLQIIREGLIQQLIDADTLVQNTPSGGKHFIFKFNPNIKQIVNIGGVKKNSITTDGTYIDTRNEGGYILVAPSKIGSAQYVLVDTKKEIKELSENIVTIINQNNSTQEEPIKEEVKLTAEEVKTLNEGEGRNSVLTSIGGILINKFKPEDTEFVLSLISSKFFNPPLPQKEIRLMLKSLSGYKKSEEDTNTEAIYDYIAQMKTDITAEDILRSCFDGDKTKRGLVDKYLSRFVQIGKIVRTSRGHYSFRESMEWTDDIPTIVEEYHHKIPYFQDVAKFQEADIVLLGAQTNAGKTTIAMNIMQQVIAEGIKPRYIFTESGSRFQKTAKLLGIEGKYFRAYHSNPLTIELLPNEFTVLDWLHIEQKEYTDTIFKHINEEVQRKKGILVIFTQLKKDNTWFAPNLIDQFPSFAARYLQNNMETKTDGYWQIDKMKEPRGNYTSYTIPCKFDFDTKTLKKDE